MFHRCAVDAGERNNTPGLCPDGQSGGTFRHNRGADGLSPPCLAGHAAWPRICCAHVTAETRRNKCGGSL